jgi:mono/diheme cytochrome c family protein
MRSRRTTEVLLVLALVAVASTAQGAPVTYADLAPLLEKRCAPCHSGPAAARGLQVDSYAGLLGGSARGPVVKAGDPDASELLRRLTGASLPRMPLTGPPFLDEADVVRFRAWIEAGLPEGSPRPATVWRKPAAKPSPLPPPGTPVTWNEVAPLFATRCAKCHTDGGLLGDPPEGYRLTTYDETLASGERARVVPGNPPASELLRRLRGQSLPRMPYDGPPYLDPAEVTLVERWIADGARDGQGRAGTVPMGADVRFEGTLGNAWRVDDLPLRVTAATRIDKRPGPGDRVEVRGRVAADGTIHAERIRRR